MNKVIEFLKEYCRDEGWEDTDSMIEEILTSSDIEYEEVNSKHRWYYEVFRVVQIKDKLIGYNWYENTGDNGISDMGLKFDMNSVYFVEKKQKLVDYYEKVEE